MDAFQELGARVERLWSAADYDEAEFPETAAAVLKDLDLPHRVSPWGVIDWSLQQTVLPAQRDLAGRFGDPPITVFNSGRFHVDVYFWFQGTTSLHQHAFCGAFQVFQGSSLHSHYGFEMGERINEHMELGQLRLETSTLLETGDVKKIEAGRAYIHSLFHLDHPSATIVVRNNGSPRHQPQYAYHKPSLAINSFYEEPNTTKKLQCLSALARGRRPDTLALISRWLETADFHTTFSILQSVRPLLAPDGIKQVFGLPGSTEGFEGLFEAVRSRHGDQRADILSNVFAEQSRIEALIKQRSYVTGEEHRYFLALLMNADHREQIFALIKKRHPDCDPLEKVLDWVMDLARTRVLGGGAATALGVAGFEAMDLVILEYLLCSMTDAEMREALRAGNEGSRLNDVLQGLEGRIERIRQAGIFQPLLRRGSH